MRRGSSIIDSGANSPEVNKDFRSLAVIGPNKEYAGIAAVNRDENPTKKTFRIAEEFNDSGKVYVYLFNEQQLQLGEDGFVKYNQVLDTSLTNQIEMEVPSDTLLILSSKEL